MMVSKVSDNIADNFDPQQTSPLERFYMAQENRGASPGIIFYSSK